MSAGVLSDKEIVKKVEEQGELIVVSTFDRHALKPASYDVTAASDGIIEPGGREVAPDGDGRHVRGIVLHPGDATLLTTVERFRMPPDVSGNVVIRNQFAAQGLLLLSGMLIDPGYGMDGDEHGCRLYLNVANIGRESIGIKLGFDRIARVQFLQVHGEHDPEVTQRVTSANWSEATLPALGFLTELKELREKVQRTSTMTEVAVTLGVLVLGITLLGVSLGMILSIGAEHDLARSLHELRPATAKGWILSVLLLMSVTANTWLLSRLVVRRLAGGPGSLRWHWWRLRVSVHSPPG